MSAVDYETFLGTGAAYLVPTILFVKPGVTLGAQANYVLFESGNQILQGSLAGGWLTPLGGRVRAELSGSAGLAAYTDAPRYGHALAQGRVHVTGPRGGAWAGGVTGRSFLGGESTSAHEVALGVWTVRSGLAIGATATRTWFAELAYTDIVARAHWVGAFLELDGSAGTRTWVTGIAGGAYGELGMRVPVSDHLAVAVRGGSYPSDPVRGAIAASYASVGLHLRMSSGRPSEWPVLRDALARAYGEASADVATPRLLVEWAPDGLRRLEVVAPGASAVEITGDFTDWEPVALRRLDRETFAITLRIVPGAHRLAVRLDGGPWLVPGGVRAEEDGFGGTVGVVVVSER